MPEIANALSIDVEDYFQVSALAPHIPRSEWERMPCRIERNVDTILALLDESGARATFFILGWIAERYPSVVTRIAAAGHEVASHGYAHHRVSHQGRAEFYEDILGAKRLLEDIAGVEVRGYRAPSFSIDEANIWAFDCIVHAGYRYSSSIYPIRHDHYGMPHAPRFAFEPMDGLTEIPATTARILGANVPAAGGGYFRLLPYAASRALIRRVNAMDGQSAIFYFHPWELDPDQPRIPGTTLKTRFRHYLNLHLMEERLRQLLRDFTWRRVDEVFLDSKPTATANVREHELAPRQSSLVLKH
jgi:polysaccharide deacetylase family protein (PEP-CTERM system associated)